MDNATVSTADYAYVAALLRNRCALVLEPGKEYLVRSRLSPLAKRHDVESVSALIAKLRTNVNSPLVDEVVEAMVTTETSFFRDTHPFDALQRAILPDLIERRRSQRQLNVWCAASSSGQEPYSVAMLLKENFPELGGWRVNLFATDVSQEMIRRGKSGRYSQTEVNRGLPVATLLKWFRQEEGAWQLDDQIRGMVTFAQMNLARPWPSMPLWDLIFLRNVMIYFDVPSKKGVLAQAARSLSKDGYLLLGGAETTLNLDDSFCRVDASKPGFFKLKP